MKQALITLLETLKYPVFEQGSVSSTYPESFFTIWNAETYDQNHYDNEAVAFVWDFDVNFYSTDPALVNTVLLAAITLLKQNKWIISGKGMDIPSGVITHTGRGVTAKYLELKGGEMIVSQS